MQTASDLGKRDYVLLLDRSGSMDEQVGGGKTQTRWAYAQEAVLAVARKCAQLDADGIDVYTFNKSFQKFPNTTPEKVAAIFTSQSPQGGTDFVPVLSDAFAAHKKSGKPTTILVVTDGEPSDPTGKKALASLIVQTTKDMEADGDLAVSFIQIGKDPAATAFLKQLDDDLVTQGAKFDIVDAKTADDLETMSIEDVLLAAVND